MKETHWTSPSRRGGREHTVNTIHGGEAEDELADETERNARTLRTKYRTYETMKHVTVCTER